MDVTPFRKLKYIHVAVDTFSGFICASLQTGEATKHVISHVLSCLAAVPQPKIKHITGILYIPQGQGIVEKTHQTL